MKESNQINMSRLKYISTKSTTGIVHDTHTVKTDGPTGQMSVLQMVSLRNKYNKITSAMPCAWIFMTSKISIYDA